MPLEVALVEGPLAVLAVELRHPFLRVLVREGVVVHVRRRHRGRAHRGCRVRLRLRVRVRVRARARVRVGVRARARVRGRGRARGRVTCRALGDHGAELRARL